VEQKRLSVTIGPRGQQQTVQVELNGVLSAERLTPKMARRALRIAQGNDLGGTVYDWDYNYGYRVYARSARKFYGTDIAPPWATTGEGRMADHTSEKE